MSAWGAPLEAGHGGGGRRDGQLALTGCQQNGKGSGAASSPGNHEAANNGANSSPDDSTSPAGDDHRKRYLRSRRTSP